MLLLLVLVTSSCRSEGPSSLGKSMANREQAVTNSAAKEMVVQETDQSSDREPDAVVETDQRKIIREGDIHFQTDDLTQTDKEIKAVCAKLNATIHTDNVSSRRDRVQQRISIKVPTGDFQILVESLMEVIDKVDSKNIRVQDVTSEFVDVEARLRVRKELEARYIDLLGKAGTIKELISVERELKSIREEIESTESRLKSLVNRTSVSTLTLHFYQSRAGYFGFAGKLKRAFVNGWHGFLDFVVILTYAWPFILIGLGGLAAIFYRRKRKKQM